MLQFSFVYFHTCQTFSLMPWTSHLSDIFSHALNFTNVRHYRSHMHLIPNINFHVFDYVHYTHGSLTSFNCLQCCSVCIDILWFLIGLFLSPPPAIPTPLFVQKVCTISFVQLSCIQSTLALIKVNYFSSFLSRLK